MNTPSIDTPAARGRVGAEGAKPTGRRHQRLRGPSGGQERGTLGGNLTVDSNKLEHACRGLLKEPFKGYYGYSGPYYGPYQAISEHGCRVIYAGVPSFLALGLEDGHVPTFLLV